MGLDEGDGRRLYALTDLIIHTKELAPDYRATVGWNGNALFDERISRVDIGRGKEECPGPPGSQPPRDQGAGRVRRAREPARDREERDRISTTERP